MSKFLRWFMVGVAVLMISACGGGGGGTPSDSGDDSIAGATIKLQDENNSLVVDDIDSIIKHDKDEFNSTTSTITINEALAKDINTDTNIITIAAGDKYPLGYTGKILESHKLNDGSIQLKVEEATLNDISSVSIPEQTYELKDMNFIGAISPFGKKAENKNSKYLGVTLLDGDTPYINFDGQAIKLEMKDGTDFKYKFNDHLELVLSGQLSNFKIKAKGEYKVKSSVIPPFTNIDFSQDLEISYDSDFELALKGKAEYIAGFFNKEWKNLEESTFLKLKLKGMESTDKKGKIPIVGLVFNTTGIYASPDINSALVTSKPLGIIVWVYINMSGELTLEGRMGIAAHAHTKFSFKKTMEQTIPDIEGSVTAQEGKDYLEAPFIDGKVTLKLTQGLSVEVDGIISGIRVFNLAGELKAELKEELVTEERLSYGLETPDSEWKWSDGVSCLRGSFGAGLIVKATLEAGVGDKASLTSKGTLQWPSQDMIDKASTGRVATWFKVKLNESCFNIPSPATINDNHINTYRKPISTDSLQDVSRDNYKYAYLSNRIYADHPSDKGKELNNWKTVDVTYNKITGFKAGLYQNLSTQEYVVAYGGTTSNSMETGFGEFHNGVVDLLSDVALFSAVSLAQPEGALSYLTTIQTYIGFAQKPSAITGHSLGGGLAQYAGLYSGVKTVTFNTAPLPYNTLRSNTISDFEEVTSITYKNGLMQSVVFENDDKITNIMTPYDPVSIVSTGLMSVDSSNVGYLMGVRFMASMPPIQKIDFFITGEQIYLPVENQGGIVNFANHSMDLVEETLKNAHPAKVELDITHENGSLRITPYYEGSFVDSDPAWSIRSIDGVGYYYELGHGLDTLNDIPEGQYTLVVYFVSQDGLVIEKKQTVVLNETVTLDIGDELTKTENSTIVIPINETDGDSRIDTVECSSSPTVDLSNTTANITVDIPAYSTIQEFTIECIAYDIHSVELARDSVLVTVEEEAASTGSTQVKKTGQTKSYDEDGSETTDGSIKDDGYYQSGVTPSYSRIGDVVTDYITELQWQDDANVSVVTKPWVTQANYDAGNYSDTSGDTATTYCSDLTLDGGGWRLPTMVELQSIVVDGKYNPAIDSTVFENYSTSNNYWSSTTHANGTHRAWVVSFFSGDADDGNKGHSSNVRCVRSGQ